MTEESEDKGIPKDLVGELDQPGQMIGGGPAGNFRERIDAVLKELGLSD